MVLIVLLLGFGQNPVAAEGAAARVDIPIRQTVLPNGDTRYSVPVSIGGGAPLDAALDTGSFGLRVLSRALTPGQYEATDMTRSYVYGGGARLNGVLAKAQLGIGGAQTETPILFQLVQSVDCAPRKPHCPASRLDPKDYRIAGDGYTGKGFDAIIGTSMRKAANGTGADNPIGAMGEARWIVILPQPGSPEPGHLIVNPEPAETSGFTMFHLEPLEAGDTGSSLPGWRDAALSGCVVNQQTRERLCGKTLLDSGAPGFSVNSPRVSAPSSWRVGTAAKFELQGGDGPVEVAFTVGRGASRVDSSSAREGDEERISAGSLPFFSYEVLYDQKNGVMGFKRRQDAQP